MNKIKIVTKTKNIFYDLHKVNLKEEWSENKLIFFLLDLLINLTKKI